MTYLKSRTSSHVLQVTCLCCTQVTRLCAARVTWDVMSASCFANDIRRLVMCTSQVDSVRVKWLVMCASHVDSVPSDLSCVHHKMTATSDSWCEHHMMTVRLVMCASPWQRQHVLWCVHHMMWQYDLWCVHHNCDVCMTSRQRHVICDVCVTSRQRQRQLTCA